MSSRQHLCPASEKGRLSYANEDAVAVTPRPACGSCDDGGQGRAVTVDRWLFLKKKKFISAAIVHRHLLRQERQRVIFRPSEKSTMWDVLTNFMSQPC